MDLKYDQNVRIEDGEQWAEVLLLYFSNFILFNIKIRNMVLKLLELVLKMEMELIKYLMIC